MRTAFALLLVIFGLTFVNTATASAETLKIDTLDLSEMCNPYPQYPNPIEYIEADAHIDGAVLGQKYTVTLAPPRQDVTAPFAQTFTVNALPWADWLHLTSEFVPAQLSAQGGPAVFRLYKGAIANPLNLLSEVTVNVAPCPGFSAPSATINSAKPDLYCEDSDWISHVEVNLTVKHYQGSAVSITGVFASRPDKYFVVRDAETVVPNSNDWTGYARLHDDIKYGQRIPPSGDTLTITVEQVAPRVTLASKTFDVAGCPPIIDENPPTDDQPIDTTPVPTVVPTPIPTPVTTVVPSVESVPKIKGTIKVNKAGTKAKVTVTCQGVKACTSTTLELKKGKTLLGTATTGTINANKSKTFTVKFKKAAKKALGKSKKVAITALFKDKNTSKTKKPAKATIERLPK